ncbi:MAG: hypothetical protein JF615_09780, partial [Asticcacaulis sp.]|nr:hypothetical protein [Asticcacaulis sp.]
MTTHLNAARTFQPDHRWDRNFFLTLVGLIWLGVVMGFGGDSIDHVRKHGLDYPLIVHFHAVVFMSWLVLLTVQVLLVRRKSFDIHKRLGIFGACLSAVMAVLGSATAITVEHVKFAKTGQAPIFLSF